MKTNNQAKNAFAALTALAFITGNSVQATLLVYEGFDTATTTGVAAGPTSNGFRLQGKAGGMGFVTGSTWNTYVNSSNPITVYAQGATPGTSFSNTTGALPLLAYNGTCANLPTSGGYFGPNGTNTCDHMVISRPLHPGVTATFKNGTTTWFSFVYVRSGNNNDAGAKLALGKGALGNARGSSSNGEAIGGGSGLGSSIRNGRKVYPQFWDADPSTPGSTSGGSNYDVQGVVTGDSGNVHYLTAPYYEQGQSLQVSGFNGDQTMLHDPTNGVPHIIVGKIEWQPNGTPDVISVVQFLSNDSTLTEAAFDARIVAQPLLSSANWPATITSYPGSGSPFTATVYKPDLDQSLFDTVSIAGGKIFGDEIRIGTTFMDVVGQPFNLTIARNSPNLNFAWNSRNLMNYKLKSSTDLSTPVASWPVVQSNIVGAPPINALSIAQPADPRRFYLVEESVVPETTVLSENFDGVVTGWFSGYDATDFSQLTTWQLGTPSNVGPSAAYSSAKCYGTNITANYGTNSKAVLRTPSIDLTSKSSATLSFKEFKKIENSTGDQDFGAVRILRASDDVLLATLVGNRNSSGSLVGGVEGNSVDWESFSKRLPVIAFSTPIKIEFLMNTDSFDETTDPAYASGGFAGWYIDDVVLTAK
ncbi:MAG: hypothetical protein KGQ89_03475 [Verrucomicrobia bacterium]|nr:hypothetical protein [Verrucomicrobiota bacterium]